uniref:Uncharacterized protein n=1 Tax=Romanomermis culicivorax TaxID=13658 RepID=A0A915I649_ROMCU
MSKKTTNIVEKPLTETALLDSIHETYKQKVHTAKQLVWSCLLSDISESDRFHSINRYLLYTRENKLSFDVIFTAPVDCYRNCVL